MKIKLINNEYYLMNHNSYLKLNKKQVKNILKTQHSEIQEGGAASLANINYQLNLNDNEFSICNDNESENGGSSQPCDQKLPIINAVDDTIIQYPINKFIITENQTYRLSPIYLYNECAYLINKPEMVSYREKQNEKFIQYVINKIDTEPIQKSINKFMESYTLKNEQYISCVKMCIYLIILKNTNEENINDLLTKIEKVLIYIFPSQYNIGYNVIQNNYKYSLDKKIITYKINIIKSYISTLTGIDIGTTDTNEDEEEEEEEEGEEEGQELGDIERKAGGGNKGDGEEEATAAAAETAAETAAATAAPTPAPAPAPAPAPTPPAPTPTAPATPTPAPTALDDDDGEKPVISDKITYTTLKFLSKGIICYDDNPAKNKIEPLFKYSSISIEIEEYYIKQNIKSEIFKNLTNSQQQPSTGFKHFDKSALLNISNHNKFKNKSDYTKDKWFSCTEDDNMKSITDIQQKIFKASHYTGNENKIYSVYQPSMHKLSGLVRTYLELYKQNNHLHYLNMFLIYNYFYNLIKYGRIVNYLYYSLKKKTRKRPNVK